MQNIEKEIHDIIMSQNNYLDILENDDRWPILYHLSSLRENILEWYSFDKEASLLEIGGEFGALTPLFCKSVKEVICVCENDLQKEAIEHRCKQYSNLKVYEDLSGVQARFDYITIINPQKPIADIIMDCAKNMKETGKIIIACDNSLALKYFADTNKNPNSISKKAVSSILRNNHFSNIDFYYPVPDFRLPNSIYSEGYLPKNGDIRNINVSFEEGKYQAFNEEVVYDELCQEDMYEYFADSFLIIASR